MPRLSNERNELFAAHYAKHRNARRAARVLGLSPRTGEDLILREDIRARVAEIGERMLTRAHISADRVMLELGRLAFSDIRRIYDENGALLPIHELDDDTAASIAGMEFEERAEKVIEEDLATGEPIVRWVPVRVAKVKRYDKGAALTTLAKHFKIIGDEGDGVNALASALADRLKTARKRVEVVEEVPLSIEGQQP